MNARLPLLLLLLLPAAVQAQFSYVTNNGTITITGYTGPDGAVTIPSAINGLPVTTIGNEAFSYTSLTSITIPNTVTSIGDNAFAIGSSLTSVTIPNSVTNIGDGAFAYCTGLTSLLIPNGVTRIGDGEFFFCTNLSSITIPDSVTYIGDSAFSFCTSLTRITISNSVTSIGDYAFSQCSSLTSVTIPSSITSIADYVFSGCSRLNKVYFQGNVPSLGGGVFQFDNSVTLYYLPGTVGWGSTFAGRPTALWTLPYPLILTSNPSFGARTNQFGFNVSWATNLNVVVEAATDLANPIWSPLQTNALTNGWFYFSDPQWKNYPARFYRISSQ